MKIISRELIEKGWSGDRKYRVTDETGNSYLLRVSSPKRRERVKATFERMKRVEMLGISMCHPVRFEESEEEVLVYQSWVNGRDAEAVMPELSDEARYAYGLDAGRALKKIHSIEADGEHCWEDYFNRKIDRKLKIYAECPLKYENGDLLIRYIEENRRLLAGRPVTYQHGDYHVGNMMIDEAGSLVVIDFDKDDFGDPWEEFNRIVWSVQSAPIFARGIVDGYFDGSVPMEFWRLLALYIATNTLSSLPWAIPFGEKEIAVMRRQCEDVLRWYCGMNDPVPKWYRES